MRTTLLALLLFGALSSSAQWTLPAAPDTMSIYMTYAGDQLVAAGQLQNVGLACCLVGGAVAAITGSKGDAGLIAGGALFAAGISFQIGGTGKVIRAGRNLRRHR